MKSVLPQIRSACNPCWVGKCSDNTQAGNQKEFSKQEKEFLKQMSCRSKSFTKSEAELVKLRMRMHKKKFTAGQQQAHAASFAYCDPLQAACLTRQDIRGWWGPDPLTPHSVHCSINSWTRCSSELEKMKR